MTGGAFPAGLGDGRPYKRKGRSIPGTTAIPCIRSRKANILGCVQGCGHRYIWQHTPSQIDPRRPMQRTPRHRISCRRGRCGYRTCVCRKGRGGRNQDSKTRKAGGWATRHGGMRAKRYDRALCAAAEDTEEAEEAEEEEERKIGPIRRATPNQCGVAAAIVAIRS